MFRYFFTFILSLFFFSFTSPTLAAENWVIDNFQSQINIQPDGKVAITETINADFGNNSKHGIFRDIPYIYHTENNSKIYTEIQVSAVIQNGINANYRISTEGDFVRLQIGDANKTISGKNEYQITYLATGVLRSFENHDELYWDVIGNGWPVAITKATAQVTLPENGITDTICFQGVINSQQECSSIVISQNKANFQSSRTLNPSEGLTIVLGYTKGMVPILTVTPPATTQYTGNYSPQIYPPNGWIFLVTSLFGIGLIFYWWKKNGEENMTGAIMVEYKAPHNLRPAEVGTILDERADTLDVSATIIDLAARGYLTIEEKEKTWLFGSTDYIFARTSKNADNLLSYEQLLLEKLFEEADIVELSELKNEFYDELVEIKNELYAEIVDKKYFPKNPEKVKSWYMGLGAFIAIASIFITSVGLFQTSGNLSGFGFGLFAVGFVLLFFSRSLPKRTATGNQALKQILGYKLFIDKVETYPQRFMEKENLFNEVLPYAIVFGNTKKFAEALKDLGLKPKQPNWYKSSGSFDAIIFASHLHNFSNSLSSSIASKPSSNNSFASSGSGFSGGSSGKGFGGGGGGSW